MSEDNNNNEQNKKLNICLVGDSFFPHRDGVIMVMDNYARLLSERANTVLVVPKYAKRNEKIDVPYKVLYCKSFPIIYNGYRMGLPQLSRKTLKELKKYDFDIVHAHSPFAVSKFMLKKAKKWKIPAVMTMHTQFKEDFKNAVKSNLLVSFAMRSIMKTINRDTTEVWALNANAEKKLMEYGFKGKSKTIMPNGTNYVYPADKEQRAELIAKRYGIEKDEATFLFIGRMSSTKNIMFLANSLKLIKEKGLKFKMIFVGNGPDLEHLKMHIKDCGLNENTIFTGKISSADEISNHLSKADLFLFPSLYDTSSIVQLEAASHKVPTVFLEGAVTSSGVVDNRNGFFAKNSEQAFADRVVEIMNNKTLLNEVSENAHKEIYMHWNDIMDRVIERYNYLIEKNKNELKEMPVKELMREQKILAKQRKRQHQQKIKIAIKKYNQKRKMEKQNKIK